MKIRAIVVDDVDLARERIKFLLENSAVEIVAECENGRLAIEAIKNLKPDLVFLDVQMPEVSGFDVVEVIGVEQMPAVIFVTAYDEFAIRAFEINAVDYLLKPIDKERLLTALGRAEREIKREKTADFDARLRSLLKEVRNEPKFIKRIPVKSSRGTKLLLTEEIEWLGAAGHYVELHVGRETHLIRERLSQLEQQLDPEKFARIHRSTIVNIDHIKELQPLFSGDQLVILRDGTKLNMSRTYHEKLMLLLK